jgi:mannose-6-phosphate isomerase-like protein (cupin superfamily)
MLVRRFRDARPYEAPNHHGMVSLRLQGFDERGPKHFWTGLSQILPGGGAGPDATALEKVYVVLSGQVSVRAQSEEVCLGPLDSVAIAPNEVREFRNLSNDVASLLVIMPYPD